MAKRSLQSIGPAAYEQIAIIDQQRLRDVPVLVSIPPIGPVPFKRRLLTGLAPVSAIVAIALLATASAYLAHGNDQLARLIGRAG